MAEWERFIKLCDELGIQPQEAALQLGYAYGQHSTKRLLDKDERAQCSKWAKALHALWRDWRKDS